MLILPERPARASEPQPAEAGSDSCVTCHGQADLRVTNKKLFDYFQSWRASVHAQADVSCIDCHGGDAKAADAKVAHGTTYRPSGKGSAVSFMNVPQTCGGCHSELYDAYRTSHHFEVLTDPKHVKQAPNCVTCHGSLNAKKLESATVGAVCATCHNAKSKNHPDIPDAAAQLLNDLSVARAFANYVRLRGESPDSVKDIEAQLRALAVRWHSFDIEAISEKTRSALDLATVRRLEAQKKRTAKRGDGGGREP